MQQQPPTPQAPRQHPQTVWQHQMAIYRYDLQKWSRRLHIPVDWMPIFLVLLVLCSSISWLIVASVTLSGPASGSPSASTGLDSTQIAVMQTTIAGTEAARSATATAAAPTATLAPTPTREQDYQALVLAHTAGDAVTLTYYAPPDDILQVRDNIGTQLDEAGAVRTIKQRAYDILHDVYTYARHTPNVVVLTILGPATDPYGNNIPDDRYAIIQLTAKTAAKFNWPNLTPDRAWLVYDMATLAPYLVGH